MKKVAVIVGSLQKNSLNRLTAKAAIKLAPASLSLEIVEIGQLQMYNQDLDPTPPAEWTAFREKIKSVDAVLFLTPEYNRSFSGALKNALDVASRPWGASVWGGKPGAVISVSPGGLGGFGSNHHLRQVLSYLDVHTMDQPEAYIGSAHTLFDAEGNLSDESTRTFLTNYMAEFAAWVEKLS
ncbi:MAG TPA: NAD(P)H-dependent oxidoreductase [Bacteroidales bacterium]|nr:NAD(P)H-dependent oxidoreductase [Bacteroidales bacterium]